MIDKLNLKFGSSIEQPNLEVDITPITVFVGPNNSGKSKILIEIENYCRSAKVSPNNIIINYIGFTPFTKDEIEKELSEIESKESYNAGDIIISKIKAEAHERRGLKVNRVGIINEAQHPTGSLSYYNSFLDLHTLRLNGENRLNLLNERSAGDLQEAPQNHLSLLFMNNGLRREVRRIVFDAIGKYFVIDPTKPGTLRVRLSEREPASERQEKGWENEAIDFHKASLLIKDASDGVKAFAGIITTLLAGDPKILLIDEPEAFLHPALANKLGNEIGKTLRKTKKRLFAATHSSNFLMGCIQSGSPLNIVRLTYKNNVATARLLSKDKILHLMRNPLLRSTGVLNSLFFESVIVCEGDSDRAFYQEVNERLLSEADGRGIGNCLFINAQNKQTVWDIVKPLRELGIPATGIVDIDVLKEGGQVFTKLLEGASIPNLNHESFHSQRASILRTFTESGKNMKREGGISILKNDDKEACDNFFGQLREYGIFVVDRGELESWLKPLGATGEKSTWLLKIFSLMGEAPDAIDYTKPSTGDVWDFIGEIKSWVENPSRKGIPK